jgi:VWFA-related protein
MSAISHSPTMNSYRDRRPQKIIPAVLVLVGFALFAANVAGQYAPRITKIDKQAFPLIRLYVSVTDEAGNPMPDDQQADLFIYEDGREVWHKNLAEGWEISTVLVLDVSGSMDDVEKLQRAKEAAARYVEMAGPHHQVALVVFNSTGQTLSKFGTARNVLTAQIGRLSARGGTALQDGIGLGLELLHGRTGRKIVVALTDGIENSSKTFPQETGVSRLIAAAKKDGASIYTIGVGQDVNEAYLKRYQETKGEYLFAPSPKQLKAIFERTIKLVTKENLVEYTTVSTDRDGMTAKISVDLRLPNKIVTEESSYTKTGVIPHVRGNHIPYLLLCLLLLVLPTAFTFASGAISVIGMRRNSVERLTEESDPVRKNLKERNAPDEDEYRFKAGDLVVKCPTVGCPRVYYVRSWRFSKCHCICGGQGRCCYASLLPSWLRTALDTISRGHANETSGRSFLCRCEDDPEGF